jgi:AraC-like DNA-binding protein
MPQPVGTVLTRSRRSHDRFPRALATPRCPAPYTARRTTGPRTVTRRGATATFHTWPLSTEPVDIGALIDLFDCVDAVPGGQLESTCNMLSRHAQSGYNCAHGESRRHEGIHSVAAMREDDCTPPHWEVARSLDEVPNVCDSARDSGLLGDAKAVLLTRRKGGIGPIDVLQWTVGADLWMDCGDQRASYDICVPLSGRIESELQGKAICAGPGDIAMYQPEGKILCKMTAGSRLLVFRFDRSTVDAVLADVIGQELTSPIDFAPAPSASQISRTWTDVTTTFARELFRSHSLLAHPMVSLPFTDSLVRGLLIAIPHEHRGSLSEATRCGPSPMAIRAAVDIIEDQADLPLTVATLARRCNISVRTLHYGFRRYMDTTPAAYLRDIRLQRAHQELVAADPTVESVSSISYRWGFTNVGRFAAAHTMRYGESPKVTLRRRPGSSA